MDSFPENTPKQASYKEKATTEWNVDDLVGWIKEKRPQLLNDDKIEKLRTAEITGEVFLDRDADRKFFEKSCKLPAGTAMMLANLSRELAKEDRNRQQAEDVEMSAAADSTATEHTTKRKGPPHNDTAPPPKRTRVGESSLIINGELKHFHSGLDENFSNLLQKEGQAYFDRTRYICKLHELHTSILFCRPRRFGKSLTISMLEHFHGLQYASEHQSFYEDLDVQKDIDEGKVKAGQYFVLKFDFSKINPDPDLTKANAALIRILNSSIESFYEEYTAYLGGNFEALCQGINNEDPNVSLEKCARLVRRAIENDEQLAGIKRIYILVDEYDAFPNYYLEIQETAGEPKIAWEGTAVGATFKSFWSTVKSLGLDGYIRRIFITGISPLSLSSIGSSLNVLSNYSFDRDLSGLCGLTHSDVEDALEKIYEEPTTRGLALLEMIESFNGYHFCKSEIVESVFNTETCLAYLQRLIQKKTPDVEDPENSEISEHFLQALASSAPVIADFEKATKLDDFEYTALEYKNFKTQLTLRDLSASDNHAAWTSLTVYFGGLTFHPEKPTSHLKIPNSVAYKRIARAVLEKCDLRSSWTGALQYLVDDGKIEETLRVYRGWMAQRDVTDDDLSKKGEVSHRDDFYFRLLEHPLPVVCPEFRVIKKSDTEGRVDLVLQVHKWLIVTEWKFYRIPFLDVRVRDGKIANNFTKAATLYDYDLAEILQLKWNNKEQYKIGTLESWITVNEASQLRGYVTGSTVKQLLKEQSLELRAHLVIIVGSRHILLWDMDGRGNLAAKPHLVEMPSKLIRQDGCSARNS